MAVCDVVHYTRAEVGSRLGHKALESACIPHIYSLAVWLRSQISAVSGLSKPLQDWLVVSALLILVIAGIETPGVDVICLDVCRFEGPGCDVDINECVRGTDNCASNAACLNTQGTLTRSSLAVACKPVISRVD